MFVIIFIGLLKLFLLWVFVVLFDIEKIFVFYFVDLIVLSIFFILR